MFAKIKKLLNPEQPPWIKLALSQVGTHEVRGGENPKIIEYHGATNLKATEDEVAWCSSFMNWVMRECGMERTHSAAARSWLGYGPKLKGFKRYSIVVLRRGGNAWQGHVGFAMRDMGEVILVLGGNQGDSVSIRAYKKSDVLGYFWPRKMA